MLVLICVVKNLKNPEQETAEKLAIKGLRLLRFAPA